MGFEKNGTLGDQMAIEDLGLHVGHFLFQAGNIFFQICKILFGCNPRKIDFFLGFTETLTSSWCSFHLQELHHRTGGRMSGDTIQRLFYLTSIK